MPIPEVACVGWRWRGRIPTAVVSDVYPVDSGVVFNPAFMAALDAVALRRPDIDALNASLVLQVDMLEGPVVGVAERLIRAAPLVFVSSIAQRASAAKVPIAHVVRRQTPQLSGRVRVALSFIVAVGRDVTDVKVQRIGIPRRINAHHQPRAAVFGSFDAIAVFEI